MVPNRLPITSLASSLRDERFHERAEIAKFALTRGKRGRYAPVSDGEARLTVRSGIDNYRIMWN